MVGDFDIPVMYQDLANYTMGPINIPLGGITGGMYDGNTSYLGGVRIKPQLDNDKVQLMNKKESESKKTALAVGLGLGIVFLMGFIPGLFGKKSAFKILGEKISNGYKSIKPALNKFWTKIKGKPNKWGRFKNYCNTKWTAFKGLFKKNTPAPKP